MSPQLSVIIPTYKRTDSLEKLLSCLQAQTNIVLEIIVVDQNESGFFKGILSEKFSGIIHIIQSSPNASLARNNGYKKASAPYILFLDDDLVPDPSFCFEGLAVFYKYPLIECFVPLVYSESGKKAAYNNIIINKKKEYSNNTVIYQVIYAMSAAVFFKKSYFKLTGGFDIHLFDFAKTAEDQEFFLRMKKRNMDVWFVPSVEIFHDEKIAGGCELRTAGYWSTREKCMRALTFRHRIHNNKPGKLSVKDKIKIARSSYLNKKIFFSGIRNIIQEINLMQKSIKKSEDYFLINKEIYSHAPVNFLH